MTGKKTITATIVMRGRRLSGPEPVERDRREGDDRDRAGTDRHRQQHLAGARPARGREPGGRPERDTEDEPEDRLGAGEHEAAGEGRPVGRELLADDARARDQERLDAEDQEADLPERDDDDEHRDRGQPLPGGRGLSRQPFGADPLGLGDRRRLIAGLVLPERLADARDEPEVALRFARLDRALRGQVDVHDRRRSGPAAPT